MREGTKRDAILFAVGDNATHGLRRTNEDKRRAVMMLLNDEGWAQWSDWKIAEACKVSNHLVGKIRSEVTRNIPSERTYTTKHGTPTTMKTGNIGKRPAPPPDEDDERPETITIDGQTYPLDYETIPHGFEPLTEDSSLFDLADPEDDGHLATAEDGLLLLEDPDEITIPVRDVAGAARIIAAPSAGKRGSFAAAVLMWGSPSVVATSRQTASTPSRPR